MYDPYSLQNQAKKILFVLEREDYQELGGVKRVKSTGLANANPKFSKRRIR